VTLSDICRRGGFIRTTKEGWERGDVSYLQRMVGAKPYSTRKNGKRYYSTRKTVDYDTAVKLCDALNVDYTEAGV
jgi:hypothetical protein